MDIILLAGGGLAVEHVPSIVTWTGSVAGAVYYMKHIIEWLTTPNDQNRTPASLTRRKVVLGMTMALLPIGFLLWPSQRIQVGCTYVSDFVGGVAWEMHLNSLNILTIEQIDAVRKKPLKRFTGTHDSKMTYLELTTAKDSVGLADTLRGDLIALRFNGDHKFSTGPPIVHVDIEFHIKK